MGSDIKKLAGLIEAAKAVTFFGGAGVSTESGIPDFRSASGLYHQKHMIPPEEVLSHSFFMKHPEQFYAFYQENLLSPDARPNAAHLALAQLEKMGKLLCVVTQNIDGLHQMAGSKKVFELHGSTAHYHCLACGKRFEKETVINEKPLPRCACGGLIRPDVVLYEEGLDGAVVEAAVNHIKASDLLIVGGTSLTVYPAAGFVQYCPGKLVIINRDPTPFDGLAALVIRDSIGQVLEEAVSLLSPRSGRF